MEYQRKQYLNRLVSSMGTDQVKVVTGVRRCGKSYLLGTLFKRFLIEERGTPSDHVVEVSFDGFINAKYRDPNAFLDFIGQSITDDGQYFLLLDEVQLLGSFAEVLNDLIRMKNVDVFVTGSNAKFLSRDVVTEFRGRGEEIPMRPLSFSEFMECYEGDKREAYEEYALYGGLPAVTQREGDQRKADYLSGIYQETYIRDILDREDIRNPGDFEDVVDVLSSNIGTLTNPNKIANTFASEKQSKISHATVERYIGLLEDSFLFEAARRYDVKGRKYIGANVKYYAVDQGLRNARLNFRQVEETHIMENIIYNELRCRGYNVDVGVVSAQKRNSEGKAERVNYECDFVCNMGSRRCYVQSAYAMPTREKEKQEQASLLRIGDSFKKIIIVKDGAKTHYNDNGFLIMNLYDFLLDDRSLEL